MGMKVAKFGGSSLADAAQFKKVREILLSDEDRRIVVPSAPGKRSATDIKVTICFISATCLAASAAISRRLLYDSRALPRHCAGAWADG